MLLDLVQLLRQFRRSPASAAAAIAILSLTLGAGASIYAVVDAVLLTPPPFANPDALVAIGEAPLEEPTAAARAVRYATFEAWREGAASIASMEAIDGTNLTLTGLGPAERLSANSVTPGFLSLLGVTPALGRAFTADDVGQPVAIVSHAFWRGKLAGDPNVIGRELMLGSRAYAIVGVLHERFSFSLSGTDLWLPLPVSPAQAVRTGVRVSAVARLAPYVTAADLARLLDDVSRSSQPPARAVATPMATAITGDARRPLGLLAGAAAIALLIAFTNLAGLLIVRSIDRRRELALRSALGARRWDIARQLLLEAQVLVAIGILGGVLIAWWITPSVAALALAQFGGVANRDIAVNWTVVAVVALAASACAWMCASLPALMAARQNAADVLHRSATPAPRERWLRRAFVTAEVAIAFVLLVSMTLLGRSLLRVLDVNPGFDPRGVLTLNVSVPAATYPDADRVLSFYSALQRALEERLGAGAIAIINEIPLTSDRGRILVSAAASDPGREAVVREAGTAYFDVLRIPLVAGRAFDARDSAAAPTHVVLGESLAERLFGTASAIGRQVRLDTTGQPAEVVGVVGDVKHRALDDPLLPSLYLSAWQTVSRSRHIVVRGQRPDADVITAVRAEVARLDRDLPVYGARTMVERVAMSPGVPARRILTATFTAFAVLAVLLGAIGLYGVVAHDVACRRPELALRIALGANPGRILLATIGQGATLVGAGLAIGGVLSLWAVRAIAGMLYEANSLDALVVVMAAAGLSMVGIGAVLPAARRAARTDPLIALRSE